ncbi:hypothetical protein BH23CHL7_BH23CHL7_09300 [soil metagenome]
MNERRLAGLAVAGVLVAALMPERMAREGTPLCLFRRATGLPCPSCGMTRSWNAAARLRLRDSVRFHPFGLPALGATLFIALQLGRGRQPSVPAGVGVGLGAAWLGVWLGRLRAARGG